MAEITTDLSYAVSIQLKNSLKSEKKKSLFKISAIRNEYFAHMSKTSANSQESLTYVVLFCFFFFPVFHLGKYQANSTQKPINTGNT